MSIQRFIIDYEVNPFIVYSILTYGILAILSAIFLFTLRLYRSRKFSNKNELMNENILLINQYLFSEDSNSILPEISSALNQLNSKKRQYKRLKGLLVQLHKSYSGEFAIKIETLYYELKLNELSISLCKKRSWYQKQRGYRDVGEMNNVEARELVIKDIYHKNRLVRLEAIVALFKIDGFAACKELEHIDFEMDEWTIINIIHIFQELKEFQSAYLVPLYRSSNISVQLLSFRLIAMYRLHEAWNELKHYQDYIEHPVLKTEFKQLEIHMN